MRDATFACPDLTTFCRLDALGLEVTGQRLEPDRAVLACRVLEADRWCRRCGCEGAPRDSVTRALAHEPFGWRPTTLLITVSRYRCPGCGHVWRQDLSKAAQPRAKLSVGALRWALVAIVCQHLTVARVAEALGVAWNTANDAVLAEGRRVLISDTARFDGVKVIGVDEHVWRHTRNGDKYVTVIIDLTLIRDKTCPARLLDMVKGRSKAAFKTWGTCGHAQRVSDRLRKSQLRNAAKTDVPVQECTGAIDERLEVARLRAEAGDKVLDPLLAGLRPLALPLVALGPLAVSLHLILCIPGGRIFRVLAGPHIPALPVDRHWAGTRVGRMAGRREVDDDLAVASEGVLCDHIDVRATAAKTKHLRNVAPRAQLGGRLARGTHGDGRG